MAILTEFLIFKNEQQLIRDFIIPLLHRLGFTIVVNYHGKREFGKDLVIGEIDRFNHIRYHGLQAKHEASIGKEAVHSLIRDCDEAFAKDFSHPQTGQEHKISSFFAVTSGTISDEARDLFFATLRPKHGDNVRLLAGSDLIALDRSAMISRVENVRDLMVGLLIEAGYNEEVLQRIIPTLQNIAQGDGNRVMYPPTRLRLKATETYLIRPFLIKDLPVEIMERFWSNGIAFNRALDDAHSSALHTVETIKMPAKKALQTKTELLHDVNEIKESINLALAKLGLLAPM